MLFEQTPKENGGGSNTLPGGRRRRRTGGDARLGETFLNGLEIYPVTVGL